MITGGMIGTQTGGLGLDLVAHLRRRRTSLLTALILKGPGGIARGGGGNWKLRTPPTSTDRRFGLACSRSPGSYGRTRTLPSDARTEGTCRAEVRHLGVFEWQGRKGEMSGLATENPELWKELGDVYEEIRVSRERGGYPPSSGSLVALSERLEHVVPAVVAARCAPRVVSVWSRFGVGHGHRAPAQRMICQVRASYELAEPGRHRAVLGGEQPRCLAAKVARLRTAHVTAGPTLSCQAPQ